MHSPTPTQVLLVLRVVETVYMMICWKWVIDSPRSPLRTLRLWACWVIIMFNLLALMVCVFWLKVDLL